MSKMSKLIHFADRYSSFLARCGLLLTLMGFSARAETLSCGNGVELTLSAAEAIQGTALLVELRAPGSLTNLGGRWRDRNLFFWVTEDTGAYQTFIGIDLAQPVESFPLTLTSDLGGGKDVVCETLIHVQKGSYTVERLTVDQKFIELSEKDLARYNREARRLRGFWTTATPERLWAGGFRIPVKARRVSGNFGRRRVLNGESRSPHSGEDFPADRGTPVRAAQRGRVVMAQGPVLFRQYGSSGPRSGSLHPLCPSEFDECKGGRYARRQPATGTSRFDRSSDGPSSPLERAPERRARESSGPGKAYPQPTTGNRIRLSSPPVPSSRPI